MKVTYHVLSALPLGIGYYCMSHNVSASLLSMGMAMILDIDHCLDYILTQKRVVSLTKMIEAFGSFKVIDKNYFFLHSWEVVAVLAVLSFLVQNTYIVAVFTGFLLHILMDQFYNTMFLGKYNVKAWFYFFVYRLSLEFDVLQLRVKSERISRNEEIY